MRTSAEHMEQVSRYLDGRATEEEVADLEKLMLETPQLRADFLEYAKLDAALPAAVVGNNKLLTLEKPAGDQAWRKWVPFGIAATLAILLGGLLWKVTQQNDNQPPVIGHFAELKDCRWMDVTASVKIGDNIYLGQRIDLSAGSAQILFNTGARLELIGPVIANTQDANSLFLSMGEASLVAETEEAKGFTITTPSTTFVDISTAFTARVSADGLSRLDVSEGEVDVILGKDGNSTRLRAGEVLYVEPGERKIITRIESGDGTPSFHFPSIPPPSSDDYADRSNGVAKALVLAGDLGKGMLKNTPLAPLLDGKGQSKQDSPRESVYFSTRHGGAILLDLGKPIPISMINSYSWHQHQTIQEHRERARQQFILYGFSGDKPPEQLEDPRHSGWERIARVNSDSFFHVRDRLDRPPQQACSISAAEGNIGIFRYLLLEVGAGTFFGELDVFTAEPSLTN